MKVDYIIVGLGLAGLCFIEILKKNNKSFLVFENKSQNSSKVAAGMFNPVVLKRFTPVWNGQKQLLKALPFFREIENRLKKKYLQNIPIYRVFKSVEEQNNWFFACDNPLLSPYMSTPILSNENEEILAPFGFGKLTNTGKLNVKPLLSDYKKDLKSDGFILEETFVHNNIDLGSDEIGYKNITAKQLVFCEGFGLKDNPYFNNLPMNEAKGELLTIRAPNLKIDYLLKAAVFVLPLYDDLYKVGATFNWKDKTTKPSLEGKQELIEKLKTTITSEYKIVNHEAGIRPTVKDRRPLIGVHSEHKKLAILNGLGTRGVMIAPTMAEKLFDYIENDIPLDKEIDIVRFKN